MHYSIILVSPAKAQNLGSICRLAENFGSPDLLIVDNNVDLSSLAFQKTAKHAREYITAAKFFNTLGEALKETSFSIATTRRFSETSAKRMVYEPESIKWDELGTNPAIVFGSERYGLSNEQLLKCDLIVSIPTSPKNPSLNLSHAVALMCYQAYRNLTTDTRLPDYQPAGKELRTQLENSFEEYAKRFLRPEKSPVTQEIFHNLIGRSKISRGEASNLIGAFKAWKYHVNKLEKELENYAKES